MIKKLGKLSSEVGYLLSPNIPSVIHIKNVCEVNSETPETIDLPLIPGHQLEFWSQHFTINQIHKVTLINQKALEKKKCCSAMLLIILRYLIMTG